MVFRIEIFLGEVVSVFVAILGGLLRSSLGIEMEVGNEYFSLWHLGGRYLSVVEPATEYVVFRKLQTAFIIFVFQGSIGSHGFRTDGLALGVVIPNRNLCFLLYVSQNGEVGDVGVVVKTFRIVLEFNLAVGTVHRQGKVFSCLFYDGNIVEYHPAGIPISFHRYLDTTFATRSSLMQFDLGDAFER